MDANVDPYTVTESDQKWVHRLELSGAGRQLLEHLSAVDMMVRNCSRPECAPQQCADFRRLFCYAFSKSARCFGLPTKTPKCVCIANLSGYRAMYYSDNLTLARMLCMIGPEASQRVIQGVQKMFDFAAEHNTSILLCMSLPWQAGIERVHWELRTLERTQDGTVLDGKLAFGYTFDEPRVVVNTNDVCNDEPRVLEEQERAFSRHFSRACLDLELTDDQETGMGGDQGFQWSKDQIMQLKSCLAMMGNERTRLIESLNEAKKEHDLALSAKETSARERISAVVEASKRAEDAVKQKVKAMEEHNATLMAQLKDLQVANKTLMCEKAEAELLWGSERQKLATAAKLQETSAAAATKQLSNYQRSAQKSMDKIEESHRVALEEKDRRISTVQMDVRRIERHAETLTAERDSLEEVNAMLRKDVTRLSIDLHNSRRSRLGFKCALAVACMKHDMTSKLVSKHVENVKSARMAHVEAVDKLREAQDQISVLKSAITSAEAQKCESVAINTEPMQDPPELIKLREDYASLHNECAELKGNLAHRHEEVERLERRLARKTRPPPPPGLIDAEDTETTTPHSAPEPVLAVALPVEPTNNARHHAPPQQTPKSAEVNTEPQGDPATEALILQASSAMTALANMARQACIHKNTASCMFSELNALKQFFPQNAYMDAPGWHNLPAVQMQQPMQQSIPQHSISQTRSPYRGRGGRT